jgi:hypothetical protein
MNGPRPPRCALARIMSEPMDKDAIKVEGWHDQGILVISKDDARLNMIEREFVRIIGDKIYGKGKGK